MASGGRKLRVRRLGGSRAGEMRLTRFLRNDAVTCEEMLSEAAARTAERCAGRHVVAIQDTTVLDSSGGGGAYLHAVIALDGEDDAILGLVDGQFLERSGGRRAGRRQARIEEKESFRWLMGGGPGGFGLRRGGFCDGGGRPRERHLRDVRVASGGSGAGGAGRPRPGACRRRGIVRGR
ncbi:hypothetical protein [Sinorhizobium fredii]